MMSNSSERCAKCGKRVYHVERVHANGFIIHKGCLRCSVCDCTLRQGNSHARQIPGEQLGFYLIPRITQEVAPNFSPFPSKIDQITQMPNRGKSDSCHSEDLIFVFVHLTTPQFSGHHALFILSSAKFYCFRHAYDAGLLTVPSRNETSGHLGEPSEHPSEPVQGNTTDATNAGEDPSESSSSADEEE